VLVDLVNGADVWVIQRRGGPSFMEKAFFALGILCEFGRFR